MKQSTFIVYLQTSILSLANCYDDFQKFNESRHISAIAIEKTKSDLFISKVFSFMENYLLREPHSKYDDLNRLNKSLIFIALKGNYIKLLTRRFSTKPKCCMDQLKNDVVLKNNLFFKDSINLTELNLDKSGKHFDGVFRQIQWSYVNNLPFDYNVYESPFLRKTSDLTEMYCENNPENEIKSNIFKSLSFKEFSRSLELNIDKKGDNLDQSHLTDLCGKYCVVRLWIKHDPENYKKTMQELYFKGRTRLKDGTLLKVSDSVINVINSLKGFKVDAKQLWGTNVIFPSRTDMLLMLTLADNFHFRFGSTNPYSNEDNFENNGFWAGSTIGAELKLLKALGFKVRRYGDNFLMLTKTNIKYLEAAILEGSTVFLLVNSYKLNTVAINKIDRPVPGLFQRSTFGTHWIALEKMVDHESFQFWEYGSFNIAGHNFWKTVCGGLVVSLERED